MNESDRTANNLSRPGFTLPSSNTGPNTGTAAPPVNPADVLDLKRTKVFPYSFWLDFPHDNKKQVDDGTDPRNVIFPSGGNHIVGQITPQQPSSQMMQESLVSSPTWDSGEFILDAIAGLPLSSDDKPIF